MSETQTNRHAPPLNHTEVASRPAKSPNPPRYNDEFNPDMTWKPVGAMFGLTNFGINIVTLPPGGGLRNAIGTRPRMSSFTSLCGHGHCDE
jgi:hypothetical protein